MEEALLRTNRENEEEEEGLRWEAFIDEVKRIGYIAGPMATSTLSLYLINVISMMMAGHLGQLALSSSAIAISLSAVTGFSLLSGMSSALETLCGQAFGAEQYRKLANQTYAAIFSLFLVSIAVSIIWINMEKLLTLTVFKTGLRNLGGALAISISNWLNVFLLALYMKFSFACDKTRVPISMEMFQGVGEFFRYAIPSVVMICLQWWSCEFVVLLSGLLPNPQLETSVLSVCLTTIATLYGIPYGFSAGVSTRVSNELGAGNPRAARNAVSSVMIIGVAELILVSGTVFASRHVFGYIFSEDKEVIHAVDIMAPLVCLSIIFDGLQGIFSGVARGCGWQHIGAYINLGSLYLCGIPTAIILGFYFHYKGKGLWIGIQVGAFLQTVLLFIVISKTNWETQVQKARERVCEERTSVEKLLI